MLTLIGREVRDHLVHLLALVAVTGFAIAVLIAATYEGIDGNYAAPLGFLGAVLLTGFCILGAAQMYGDRAHRISALLATLAVTRGRLLAARILVGVMAVLVCLGAVVVTVVVLLRIFLPPFEFYRRMVVEIALTMILTGLACYCAGLLVGWTTNRARLVGGSALALGLLLSLVWIKGFGPEVMVLLVLIIAALLLRLWQTFTSASL